MTHETIKTRGYQCAGPSVNLSPAYECQSGSARDEQLTYDIKQDCSGLPQAEKKGPRMAMKMIL